VPDAVAAGDGLGDGDAALLDGDAAGVGEDTAALGDGDGVTGGVGASVGVGVGSPAFADIGKNASSATARTTPTGNLRSMRDLECPRALIHRTQVHPPDERAPSGARSPGLART
jgi:hypothetical protein